MPRFFPAPSSGTWALAEVGASAFFSFASMLAIGRIIGPQAAGTGMVAVAAFLFLDLVSSIWTEALVQRPDLTERHTNSAVTAAVLAGMLCGGILAASALLPGVEGDGMPGMSLILTLAALLPISALVNSAIGIMLRRSRFRLLAMRILIGQPIALVVGVAAGLAGLGPWALVALQMASTVTSLIVLLFFGGLRLRPVIDMAALVDLAPVAGPQSAAKVVEVGKFRLLVIGLGSVLSSALVAQFNVAIRVVDGVTGPVWTMMSRISLPRLCAAQHDRGELRVAYGELAELQSLLGLPITVGIALTARDLTETLLGPAWVGMGEAIRTFAIGSVPFFLIGSYGTFFVAIGRTRINFYLSAGSAVLQVLSLAALRPETAGGVALSLSLHAVVLCPAIVWLVARNLGCSFGWLLSRSSAAMAATLSMTVAVLTLQHEFTMSPQISLVASIVIGGAVYIPCAWFGIRRRWPVALRHSHHEMQPASAI